MNPKITSKCQVNEERRGKMHLDLAAAPKEGAAVGAEWDVQQKKTSLC